MLSAKSTLVTSAFLLAASACASDGDDLFTTSALVTIHGEIRNPQSLASPTSLRLALVWAGARFNVARELSAASEFPARFELEIEELPPDDVWHSSATHPEVPEGLRFAYASVLGYEDVNANEQLDLVDATATEFIDRIVATNETRIIVYVEGTDEALALLSREVGANVPRGFSMIDRSGPERRVLAISEPYDLALATDPRLNDLMCQATPESGGGGGAVVIRLGAPEAYPSSDDPNLICAENGASYTYAVCTAVQDGPCRDIVSVCEGEQWSRPDPPPLDWPCSG
jgi:hypothetical protein